MDLQAAAATVARFCSAEACCAAASALMAATAASIAASFPCCVASVLPAHLAAVCACISADFTTAAKETSGSCTAASAVALFTASKHKRICAINLAESLSFTCSSVAGAHKGARGGMLSLTSSLPFCSVILGS